MLFTRSARICSRSIYKTLQNSFLTVRTITISTRTHQLYIQPSFNRSIFSSALKFSSDDWCKNSKKRIATYEEVVNLVNSQDTILVDVRESDEIKETGQIPKSIHIPVGSVKKALQNTSEHSFKISYNINKPSASKEIIFYCRTGVRSQKAMETAIKLGYENARSYKGSWSEWSEKQKNTSRK